MITEFGMSEKQQQVVAVLCPEPDNRQAGSSKTLLPFSGRE
jgi:hypothetical protein